jgi:hypothetical protein
MQYWSKLTVVQKESLLSVAKNYIELKEKTDRISIEEYNQEIDEAMKRMNEGEYYTHEQVAEMSKSWINAK